MSTGLNACDENDSVQLYQMKSVQSPFYCDMDVAMCEPEMSVDSGWIIIGQRFYGNHSTCCRSTSLSPERPYPSVKCFERSM